MGKINKEASLLSCPARTEDHRAATKLSAVYGRSAPSGSLVTEKRAQRRKRKKGDVKARLCPLDKRILQFAWRFREFHSTVLSLAPSLVPLLWHTKYVVHEEPSNLANDVLKISDNVFSLLYDPIQYQPIF